MKQILCIEDNPEIILLLEATLKSHQVDFARDLSQARKSLSQKRYDLVTLDVGLPDGDGLKFLNELMGAVDGASIPVFVLTADNELTQKVSAFNFGADDYIVKPFDPRELIARIDAKFKKLESQRGFSDNIKIGDLTISVPKQKVWMEQEQNQRTIPLTSLEFKLLLNLINANGRVLSRLSLLKEVWGEEMHVTDRTVDTHIGHLRKKIADSKVQIQTVVGEGYRIVV
jgi:two-component system alkaline phosphatase synthesis response regulator PhoP